MVQNSHATIGSVRATSRNRTIMWFFHVVWRNITFNDSRRFGLMDPVPPTRLGFALEAMGPEPLEETFDGARLARACAGKRVSLKVALLDQRVVAGLGNIYASEALHRALSPRRRAGTIATPSGQPRPPRIDWRRRSRTCFRLRSTGSQARLL